MTCFISKSLPTVASGDAIRLRQVLHNLVSNAVKFTKKGEVRLTARLVDRSETGFVIQIEVSDTGVGIPEKERAAIFRSFSQVDDSDSRSHGGPGLGLAICKQIIMRMNGYLDYDSEEGKGSRFWIVLKLGNPAIQIKLPPPEPALKGRRVLVVAQSPSVRCMVTDQASALHLIATGVNSSRSCLAALQAACSKGVPFDFLIADSASVDPSTVDLARSICNGKWPLRIIVLTSESERAWIRTQEHFGSDAILAKPVRPYRLAATLTGLSANPAQKKEVSSGVPSLSGAL
jgi:anti-sigma regulatory factor (Ser/Thr protein kinase)/CheY-like chemotaxis protein